MLNFKKTELKNGTRVVFVPHADTAAATLLVLCEVGSRWETKATNGASHYVEHMMFKGTKRRPNTLDISRDLDSVGADYNAFTGKDYTGYYIKLQSEKLPLAVDMLSDMLYGSLYRAKDLDSERKVILEEIHMYDDNPMSLVEELMEAELFRGSTLGWRISGTEDTMNGIGREALLKFRDSHYIPAKTVVVVSGKYDEEATMKLLEKTFGARPKHVEPKGFTRVDLAKSGYDKPRLKVHNKDTGQVQVSFGFPAYGFGDKRLAAANLLGVILGGTMSSRLFINVREKHGLAYFVRASASPYQDVGDFTVQSGLAKKNVHKAVGLIMHELSRMKDKQVTTEELKRSKDYIKGKMVLAMEDSSRLGDWFGKQELLTRKIETPDEKLERIFAVTKEDIRAAAADIFRQNRLSMAVVGPFGQDESFLKHLKAL